MWIIEVIPVSRAFFQNETLTYFSTKKLESGALVEVGLKNKTSLAVVRSAESLETKKESVKRKSFALKKINRVVAERLLSRHFISAASDLSGYFVASAPSILNFFIPKTFFRKEVLGKMSFFSAKEPETPASNENFKISVYQAERFERLKYYRAVLRETLSRGRSCAVILPTRGLAETEYDELKIGLEERTFLMHPDLSAKELAFVLDKIYQTDGGPIVVVGTPHLLAFLRPDTGTLIIDEESSEYYYNSRRRPFFDLRVFAEVLAKKTGLNLIFGDIILRLALEANHRTLSDGQPASVLARAGRLLSPAENLIIDAGKKMPGEFKILSPELVNRLSEAKTAKESFVLIGHRRGFNPTTLCQDCGKTIICQNCSSPLVIHQSDAKNSAKKSFFCHYCLKKEEIIERCPNCGSWKLANYGIGVEKIGEELKKLFPDLKIFRFDSDAVKSIKEAERIRNDFSDTPGSMLVATEIFVNFFRNPLPHIAVASIDGLFSIPDYGIHERVMGFLMRLRALAQKSFIIQTRIPGHPIFGYVESGNIAGFKKDELEERKKLGYPPAVDLIKITLSDANLEKLTARISSLAQDLKKISQGRLEYADFPAFVMKIKGQFRWHILLKLERGSWPDRHPEIKALLADLPPSWSVQVNSPSLL